MKIMKWHVKCTLAALLVLTMLCNLCGCGSRSDTEQSVGQAETAAVGTTNVQENQTQEPMTQTTSTKSTKPDASQTAEAQPTAGEELQGAQSGEDLDVIQPDTSDDKWYMSGDVYIDEKGRRLEVFFDDDGMLQFAIDGLSMYFTSANDFQRENDWRIYTCDDGTGIVYYPGTPAHLEISDGEYAGLYEAAEK